MAKPSYATQDAKSLFAVLKNLAVYITSSKDPDNSEFAIPVELTSDISGIALESGGNLDAQTASLSVMDDWDETNRAAVNLVAGQVAITAGAGAVAANTPRVTHASDDPLVAVSGATTGAAVITDANGTVQQYLRGLVKLLISNAVVFLNGGVSWISVFGISGARFTSADQSGAAVAATDAPTGGQKLVIDGIQIAAAADMSVSFTCETTGVVIATFWLLAKTSFYWNPTNKIKLATADKKLFVQTSAAGAVYVLVEYHSEA